MLTTRAPAPTALAIPSPVVARSVPRAEPSGPSQLLSATSPLPIPPELAKNFTAARGAMPSNPGSLP